MKLNDETTESCESCFPHLFTLNCKVWVICSALAEITHCLSSTNWASLTIAFNVSDVTHILSNWRVCHLPVCLLTVPTSEFYGFTCRKGSGWRGEREKRLAAAQLGNSFWLVSRAVLWHTVPHFLHRSYFNDRTMRKTWGEWEGKVWR